MEGVKNVRFQWKTDHISVKVRDRAKNTINHYNKWHTPFQTRLKSSTLDDLQGDCCNIL